MSIGKHGLGTCIECGNEFKKNRADAKFCHRSCYVSHKKKNPEQYQSRGKSTTHNSNWVEPAELKCDHCSSTFLSKNKNKRFCSTSCYSEYRTLNPTEFAISNEGIANLSKMTKQRHYKNREERLKNPSYIQRRDSFRAYKNIVYRLTEATYASNKDALNPNNYPRTLCGVDGGWQLDHKLSIRKCFDEGKTAVEASSISNLQMLPWKENLLKGA